ncbi:Maph43 [Matsumuraeses phaseoli granulovirus]|uniref:Maph43 n=1 Tax=Matsumuraeses phaseoli granulovirus TaxID=2760664 RepID=A0AAE7MLC7_9BBAC|nr:Maph43 [Matsumuraeses phaseoli granulovirus]QOD40006.1 Maph43 [Matsumuraeses phaseoli granulovirus]
MPLLYLSMNRSVANWVVERYQCTEKEKRLRNLLIANSGLRFKKGKWLNTKLDLDSIDTEELLVKILKVLNEDRIKFYTRDKDATNDNDDEEIIVTTASTNVNSEMKRLIMKKPRFTDVDSVREFILQTGRALVACNPSARNIQSDYVYLAHHYNLAQSRSSDSKLQKDLEDLQLAREEDKKAYLELNREYLQSEKDLQDCETKYQKYLDRQRVAENESAYQNNSMLQNQLQELTIKHNIEMVECNRKLTSARDEVNECNNKLTQAQDDLTKYSEMALQVVTYNQNDQQVLQLNEQMTQMTRTNNELNFQLDSMRKEFYTTIQDLQTQLASEQERHLETSRLLNETRNNNYVMRSQYEHFSSQMNIQYQDVVRLYEELQIVYKNVVDQHNTIIQDIKTVVINREEGFVNQFYAMKNNLSETIEKILEMTKNCSDVCYERSVDIADMRLADDLDRQDITITELVPGDESVVAASAAQFITFPEEPLNNDINMDQEANILSTDKNLQLPDIPNLPSPTPIAQTSASVDLPAPLLLRSGRQYKRAPIVNSPRQVLIVIAKSLGLSVAGGEKSLVNRITDAASRLDKLYQIMVRNMSCTPKENRSRLANMEDCVMDTITRLNSVNELQQNVDDVIRMCETDKAKIKRECNEDRQIAIELHENTVQDLKRTHILQLQQITVDHSLFELLVRLLKIITDISDTSQPILSDITEIHITNSIKNMYKIQNTIEFLKNILLILNNKCNIEFDVTNLLRGNENGRTEFLNTMLTFCDVLSPFNLNENEVQTILDVNLPQSTVNIQELPTDSSNVIENITIYEPVAGTSNISNTVSPINDYYTISYGSDESNAPDRYIESLRKRKRQEVPTYPISEEDEYFEEDEFNDENNIVKFPKTK